MGQRSHDVTLDMARLADEHIRPGSVQKIRAARGATGARVSAHLEPFRFNVDTRIAYVAVSRAKTFAPIYTDDHRALVDATKVRNGANTVVVSKAKEMKNFLMRAGCKPRQPVFFLGCRAANGDRSIAERYAKENGVPTGGYTRSNWWNNDGKFIGSFGHTDPDRTQSKYGVPNPNDPGSFRIFKP